MDDGIPFFLFHDFHFVLDRWPLYTRGVEKTE